MKYDSNHLKRLIRLLILPILLIVSELACTGTMEDMLVNGQPSFQCPTAIPVIQPTAPPGFATGIPQPTVTPVVIRPPRPFYLDDNIEAGGIQFRLSNVVALSGTKPIAVWQLKVTNQRSTPYEFFPAGQIVVSQLADGQIGQWGASEAAAREAGLAFRYESYHLNPRETQTVQMAAYLPGSTPAQFVYRLDPTTSSTSNIITWVNQPNPYC
ncbi:MAG: hypothetical protein GC179_23495 [Anaerolineaceae bacterium]|nr:hypothetical protein [Anaerolineaceae bacterium]